MVENIAAIAVGYADDVTRGSELHRRLETVVRAIEVVSNAYRARSTVLGEQVRREHQRAVQGVSQLVNRVAKERAELASTPDRRNRRDFRRRPTRERENEVTRELEATLRERIGRTDVPESVRDFLLDVWLRHLRTAVLRDGVGSPSYALAMQVVDDLLWSLDASGPRQSRRQLASRIPPLIRVLMQGVTDIGAKPEEFRAFLDELFVIHLRKMQKVPTDRGSTAEGPSTAAPVASGDTDAPPVLDEPLSGTADEPEADGIGPPADGPSATGPDVAGRAVAPPASGPSDPLRGLGGTPRFWGSDPFRAAPPGARADDDGDDEDPRDELPADDRGDPRGGASADDRGDLRTADPSRPGPLPAARSDAPGAPGPWPWSRDGADLGGDRFGEPRRPPPVLPGPLPDLDMDGDDDAGEPVAPGGGADTAFRPRAPTTIVDAPAAPRRTDPPTRPVPVDRSGEGEDRRLLDVIGALDLRDFPEAPQRLRLEADEALARLRRGDWLEIVGRDGVPQELKVAWINARRTVVLLVRRSDRRALSLRTTELHQRFAQHKAALIV